MDTLYRPELVEERWQKAWEGEGLFEAHADDPRPAYVIAVPPPNVTGALHMGHALNGTLQDILVRWHRMRGFNALWQPGYDHAGIGTQVVVEKELAKEGLSRHDVGREAFLERVWAWLEEYGGIIMGQYRRLGASLDYRRERFTMDPAYVRAVMRFFVHLYERGWIYRDNRMVNWCPRCATAISDLEVQHHEVDDTLTYARYPLADGSGHVTVATVRPATILADVAVAVHPGDDRYRSIVGKDVMVPVVERRVPMIEDERVEPEFGTGALKITPGHDPVDFEIGRDHGLPEPMVIGLDGRMNGEAGEFAGLTPGGGGRAGRRLAPRARPARAAGAVPALGRSLRALRHPRRAADLAAVVLRDEGAGGARDRRRPGAAECASRPRSRARCTSAGWRASALVHLAPALVGPPHSPCGTAPAAQRSSPRRRRSAARGAAIRSCTRTRTCWTPGSPPRSGRLPRSAGRTRRRTCARSTPATSTRRRARSSSSGWRG